MRIKEDDVGCLFHTPGIECKELKDLRDPVSQYKYKENICSQCAWGPNGETIMKMRLEHIQGKDI